MTGSIRLPYSGMSPCLLYADDTLFFLKPELRQVQVLKIVLTAFETIAGLAVNLDKSELVTTITPEETGQELALAMGCKLGEFPMKYLGLPLSNKILNKAAYLPLIQRFSTRLEGWAAKNLSIAGRLILINAVLSALPTYYMSCLKLPVWVIKDIDRIRRHFLWHGVTQQKKKLNLANWEIICKPKKLGGLGVMDLTVFNNAMLAKWYWQWNNPEKRIWKTIFQQTNNSLWPVPQSYFFSITLKAVYSFMDASILRIVGRGDSILFWGHNWGVGILKHEFQILYTYAIDQHQSLAQMASTRHIRHMFRGVLSEEAEEQLNSLIHKLQQQQPLQLTSSPDEASWKWTPSAQFTVSSYYHAFMHAPTIKSEVQKIWKIKSPPRMQVFSWLMMLNKILTVDNLMKRGWTMVNRCIMCRSQSESVKHLFEECTTTNEIYQQLTLTMGMKLPTNRARKALISNEFKKEERSLLLIAQFVVWRERCSRIFNDKSTGTDILVQQICEQWMTTMRTDGQILT
jgi:mannosylglycoprotein endo-beta-mannosidase